MDITEEVILLLSLITMVVDTAEVIMSSSLITVVVDTAEAKKSLSLITVVVMDTVEVVTDIIMQY